MPPPIARFPRILTRLGEAPAWAPCYAGAGYCAAAVPHRPIVPNSAILRDLPKETTIGGRWRHVTEDRRPGDDSAGFARRKESSPAL